MNQELVTVLSLSNIATCPIEPVIFDKLVNPLPSPINDPVNDPVVYDDVNELKSPRILPLSVSKSSILPSKSFVVVAIDELKSVIEPVTMSILSFTDELNVE
ncbi:hypothetical protein DCBHLPFO_00745 [Mycoplasmopsis arginini]|uniref:Uncharacterized protein n=1 Tax=Mycoplasmopsis arginini TaxID=2094 RepID=A0AA43U1P5_MYCAR|nr:hypothetical protein [Mycoplasmopsis arginini]